MHKKSGNQTGPRRSVTGAPVESAIAVGRAQMGRVENAAARTAREKEDAIMPIHTNKAVVRRYFEEVVNGGSAAAVRDLLAPEFRLQLGSAPPVDAAAVLPLLSVFRAAFPDFRDELADMVAEADRVVAWGRSLGTHQGEFMGIPATDREIAVDFVSRFRLTSDGMIREIIVAQDQLGLLGQLGVVPTPAQPPA